MKTNKSLPNEAIPNEEIASENAHLEEDKKYFVPSYEVNYDKYEIYDMFINEYKDVEVTEFELSFKNQEYVYEIEGMTSDEEIEAEYAADSGELIDLERDSYDSEKTFIVRKDLDQMTDFLNLASNDAGEEYFF